MFFQRRPSLKIYLSKTERGKVTYNSIKIESLQRNYLTKEAGIVVEIVPPLQQWNNFFWSILILSKQLDSLQQVLIEERPAYHPWREKKREKHEISGITQN